MFRQLYSGPNSGSPCPFRADTKTQLYALLKLLEAKRLISRYASSAQSLTF